MSPVKFITGPVTIRLLVIGALTLFVGFTVGCGGDAYGCPPQSLGITSGCQVQQFRQQVVQPQAVYAAPIIQQQVVSPFYSQQVYAQPVVVQQVRAHRQAVIVQQVRQPRVQVQSTRTVIRNR